MKNIIAAAILSGIAATSFAQTADAPRTREQVQAELAASKASGEYQVLHFKYVDFSKLQQNAPKSRESVKNELEKAQQNGELQKLREMYPA